MIKKWCRRRRYDGALQLRTGLVLLGREWRGHTRRWVAASERTGSLARPWASQGSHPQLCCRYHTSWDSWQRGLDSVHGQYTIFNHSVTINLYLWFLLYCYYPGHYVIPGTYLKKKGQTSEIISKTLLPVSNCTVSLPYVDQMDWIRSLEMNRLVFWRGLHTSHLNSFHELLLSISCLSHLLFYVPLPVCCNTYLFCVDEVLLLQPGRFYSHTDSPVQDTRVR